MENHERGLAVGQLKSGGERLLRLVGGLTDEQWRFRPEEGRWSIGECVEHVTCVEKRIAGLIEKKLGEGATRPDGRSLAERSAQDQLVLRMAPDRTVRRSAPEAVLPTGDWDSSTLRAAFLETRRHTIAYAAGTQGDLRGCFIPHPAFGELDCFQWLLLLGLHGERHAQQIEEIQAAPGFPPATASAASS